MESGARGPFGQERLWRFARVPAPLRWALLLILVCALVGLTVPLGQSLVPGVGGLAALALALVILLAAIPGGPAIAYFLLFPIAIEITLNGTGVVSALLATLAISAVIGLLIGTQPRAFRLCSLDVAIVTTGAASLLSIALMGVNSPSTGLLTYGLDLTTYFAIRTTIGTPRLMRAALWAFSLGGVVSAVTGEVLYGLNLSTVVAGRLGVPEVGINDFAAILAGSLGVTVGLIARSGWTARMLLFPIAAVQLAAIILSASRSAFLALVAMLAAGIFLAGYKHRWAAAVLLLGGAVLVWVFLDVPQLGLVLGIGGAQARIATILSSSALENSQRVYLWRMSVQAFTDHPLFGIGMGNFIVPKTWYLLAAQTGTPLIFFPGPGEEHNLYLAYLAELGIIGALLLVVCGYLAVRLMVRLRSTAELAPIALALAGFFTAAIFLPLQGNSLTFALPALVPVLQDVYRKREGAVPSKEPAAKGQASEGSPAPRPGTLRR